VAVFPIKPDDPDLSFKMPGNLTGIGLANQTATLASMGMIGVELTSASGEPLQLKQSTKATIGFFIPNDMLASAPATIPIWSFDEDAGIWREEGIAEKIENEYKADVRHFSFWNCDAWFETVEWTGHFNFDNDAPAGQVRVCISIDALNTKACAYAQEDGIVMGAVAKGEPMTLEVFDECFNVVLTTSIGPFYSSPASSDFIVHGGIFDLITVTGSALNCNLQPIQDGVVRVWIDEKLYYKSLTQNQNEFSVTGSNCNHGSIRVRAYDEENDQHSELLSFQSQPYIQVDSILTCISEQSKIEFNIDNHEPLVFMPVIAEILENTTTHILYVDPPNNQDSTNFVEMEIDGKDVGEYPNSAASIFFYRSKNDRLWCNTVNITINYFGSVNGYVVGTVEGNLILNDKINEPFPFIATFKAFREK
jgi:hypothetical protein